MGKTHKITLRGVEFRLCDVARATGISMPAVWSRVKRGWDIERAATTPRSTHYHKGEAETEGVWASRPGTKGRFVDVTDGGAAPLCVTAKANGISQHTLLDRIRAGWPPSIAAIMPPDHGNMGMRPLGPHRRSRP